jgi:hypothetical protein
MLHYHLGSFIGTALDFQEAGVIVNGQKVTQIEVNTLAKLGMFETIGEGRKPARGRNPMMRLELKEYTNVRHVQTEAEVFENIKREDAVTKRAMEQAATEKAATKAATKVAAVTPADATAVAQTPVDAEPALV